MTTKKQVAAVKAGGSPGHKSKLLRITNDEFAQLDAAARRQGLAGVPQDDNGVYEAGFMDFLDPILKIAAPVASVLFPPAAPFITAGSAALGLFGGEEEADPNVLPATPAPVMDPMLAGPTVAAEEDGGLGGLMDTLDPLLTALPGLLQGAGSFMNKKDIWDGSNADLERHRADRTASDEFYRDMINQSRAKGGRGPSRAFAEGGPVDDEFVFNPEQYAMSQQLNEMGDGAFGNMSSSGWTDPDMVDAYMRGNPYARPGAPMVFGTEELPVFTGMRYPDYMEPKAPPAEAPPALEPAAPAEALPDHGQVVEPTYLPPAPGDSLANAQADFFIGGGSTTTPFNEMMAGSVPNENQAAAMMTPMGYDQYQQPLYPKVGGTTSTWNPQSLSQLGYDSGLQQHSAMMDTYLNPQEQRAPSIPQPTVPVAAAPAPEEDNAWYDNSVVNALSPITNFFAEGGPTTLPPPDVPYEQPSWWGQFGNNIRDAAAVVGNYRGGDFGYSDGSPKGESIEEYFARITAEDQARAQAKYDALTPEDHQARKDTKALLRGIEEDKKAQQWAEGTAGDRPDLMSNVDHQRRVRDVDNRLQALFGGDQNTPMQEAILNKRLHEEWQNDDQFGYPQSSPFMARLPQFAEGGPVAPAQNITVQTAPSTMQQSMLPDMAGAQLAGAMQGQPQQGMMPQQQGMMPQQGMQAPMQGYGMPPPPLNMNSIPGVSPAYMQGAQADVGGGGRLHGVGGPKDDANIAMMTDKNGRQSVAQTGPDEFILDKEGVQWALGGGNLEKGMNVAHQINARGGDMANMPAHMRMGNGSQYPTMQG